jgi:hypothetical protein
MSIGPNPIPPRVPFVNPPGPDDPPPTDYPIAEDLGSGKLTFSKGGTTGTRVFFVPWIVHPYHVDRMLGLVTPDGSGPPTVGRPEVFSPQYPWLYCQEASVEGESPIGVDRAGKIQYRVAKITAKYLPLESENQWHVNAQILGIPGTAYSFVGTDPGNEIDRATKATVTITRANGGTWRLQLRSQDGDTEAQTPAIDYDADAEDVAEALLATNTISATDLRVGGPAGGPWTLSFNSTITKPFLTADDSLLTYSPVDLKDGTPAGVTFSLLGAGPVDYTYAGDLTGESDTTFPAVPPYADDTGGSPGVWTALTVCGAYKGTFQLSVTVGDPEDSTTQTTYTTADVSLDKLNIDSLRAALANALAPVALLGAQEKAGGTAGNQVVVMQNGVHYNGSDHYKFTRDKYLDFSGAEFVTPVTFIVGLRSLTKSVISVAVTNSSLQALKPEITASLSKFSNVVNEPIGKVVPNGEFSLQKHRVLALDAVYVMQVVGAVNMATFMGFPPWTLLLQGVEAKQNRLPNGTPAYDLTFKFGFNPYTWQALYRPGLGQWEFVRSNAVNTVPNNYALALPLNPLTGRADFNPDAVQAAAGNPPGAPRVIDVPLLPGLGGQVTAGDSGDDSPPDGDPDEPGVDGDPSAGGEAPTDFVAEQTLGDLVDEAVAAADSATDIGQWIVAADNLETVIAAGCTNALEGTLPEDQEAAASGWEFDLAAAQATGASWAEAISTGQDTSGANGGLPGNPASQAVAAAHRAACGATRQDFGPYAPSLAVLAAKFGAALFGDDPGDGSSSGGSTGTSGILPDGAANVGGAPSIQLMKAIDLGFIYPLADFTPLLFLL